MQVLGALLSAVLLSAAAAAAAAPTPLDLEPAHAGARALLSVSKVGDCVISTVNPPVCAAGFVPACCIKVDGIAEQCSTDLYTMAQPAGQGCAAFGDAQTFQNACCPQV